MRVLVTLSKKFEVILWPSLPIVILFLHLNTVKFTVSIDHLDTIQVNVHNEDFKVNRQLHFQPGSVTKATGVYRAKPFYSPNWI